MLLILVGLAGCGGAATGGGAAAGAADSTVLVGGIAASALPDTGSTGARLVGRYCGQCHAVPSPARHAAGDWIPTLRRMYLRMDHMAAMGGMMAGRGMGRGMMGQGRTVIRSPTPAERDTILAYLQGHAMRALAEDSLPDAGAAGAAIFRRACSRCHALPDPGQHTAAEWPAVVARMREHMQQMNVGDVSDADAQAIVAYLGRTAG